MLDESKLTAEKVSNDYQGVLGTVGFSQGRHYWEVVIDKYVSCEDIFIGVASPTATVYNNPRYDDAWYAP